MKQILGRLCFCALLCLTVAMPAWAIEPKEGGSYLDQKEFAKPELVLGSSHEPLEQALSRLPNRAAWESYQAGRQAAGLGPVKAFVDPRSGGVTNMMPALPLIPGRGRGNGLTLDDVGARLGRTVRVVDARVVADATLRFVADHRDLLAVDSLQLGEARAAQVTSDLWQVSVPQVYHGVPVRYGRLAASIDHGNLVMVGTESWGNVRGLSTVPKVSGDAAMTAGFGYAGGRAVIDEVVRQPALEIVPASQPGAERGAAFAGPVGSGYRHLLVWTFAFRRPPDDSVWEVMVDAASGEVLAFEDTNHYVDQQITGGVYPLTNTEICPNAATCGTLQSGWPIPFADTGLAAPNDFTSSAGLFAYAGGTVTTTLTGRYVDIVDTCGAISNSSATGAINLGGANGDHDCTSVGSLGNTASSRSAFYEINKLAEMARGWLPGNLWLQNRLTTNVNIINTCNAFWSTAAGTVNFYRSGGGCRNTGEIAGVFDHEWGHGLDDNDAGGVLSNSSEGYADIAAIYRLQTSCVGHGFRSTSNPGCGQTVDLTGFNANEAQVGASHCDLDCSGVRDADWDKHADHTPDTALGFVCGSCSIGSGPCGRQVHCAAAPSRQAAWDLVTRDLRAAPFNFDSQTAFIIGNKLFYQGSGNIGSWHACTCALSSDGCGASNGYMQWLAADDDDGNIANGTPHMTAIFAAFNRHGIACATPTPVNSGCGGGPSAAPALSVTAGNQQAALSWGSVPGATRYWVFRSEGHAGCDFGKTLIAETAGTAYTDTQVANGRAYSYNVVAAGTSSACFSPASNCTSVTPAAGPDFSLACSPSSLTIRQGQSGASTCTITSTGGFNSAVALACAGQPAGVSCSFVPNPATPPAGGSTNSTLTATVAASTPTGTYSFQAVGTSGALVHPAPLSVTVTPLCLPAGSLCTVNGDCCSNSCKGKPGAKTCK